MTDHENTPHDEFSRSHYHAERRHERDKKKTALIAAVAGTALFIGAIWAILLPGQLDELRVINPDERSRWQVIQEDARNDNRGFRESLESMRLQLQSIEGVEVNDEDFVSYDVEDVPLTQQEVELLRARIEAASAKNQTDDNGTN